jgi:multiple sugar transport system permease protein
MGKHMSKNEAIAISALTGAPSSNRQRRNRRLERHLLGPLMAAPTLLALLVTIVFPMFFSLALSAYSWKLTEINKPKTFVFLENYREILGDEIFWTATRNTFAFVIITVSMELILGFLIALLLTEITRGRRLANSIILLPMIITPVIVALLWRYMYDPQFGIINYAIKSLGYPETIGWLSRESLALPSIAVVDIWEMTPFVILVLHAGMLTVPEEMTEAARVDGATYWQVVRHLIIPYLMPLILLVLLLRTMDTYRVFDVVFVLTKGGPGLATEVIGLYTYRSSFIFFRMGYGMALAIVTLLIILVISLGYLRLLQVREA